MKPNNLKDLKQSLDSISPTDMQKTKMLNNILNTPSKTYPNTRFHTIKRLSPLVASLILVFGSGYYISYINSAQSFPDHTNSYSQTSPSQIGIRKFMNYNGNRYVVLPDIPNTLLNSLKLTNNLGILDTPIELYDVNQNDFNTPTNFSSTFALGSEVWETSSYDSRYRIIVKDNDMLHLCEIVGKSNDSEIDINEFIKYGDFYSRISQIDIIPYSSTNSPIILEGTDCSSFIDNLSTATFIPGSSISYDKLLSPESRNNSFKIIFRFDDQTITETTFYKDLSIISFGDNYFSLASDIIG